MSSTPEQSRPSASFMDAITIAPHLDGAGVADDSYDRPSTGSLWQRSQEPLRNGLVLVLDAAIASVAFGAALVLRFEGAIPPAYLLLFWTTVPTLALARTVCGAAFRLHRWSFRLAGLIEASRLIAATAFGSLAVLAATRTLGIFVPRSVIALEFFLTTTLMGAYRFGPRLALGWYRDQLRAWAEGSVRTIVLGAGSAGDLLLRDLSRDPGNRFHIVGVLDDDAAKLGTWLHGKQVVGSLHQLPALIEKYHVSQVLIAIPRLAASHLRTILNSCANSKVSFKNIPASYAYLDERLSAAMLHDLSPEDLLPRVPVTFDPAELRRLIEGKRILITGAAGSIGSEIARQVATHRPSALALVDINENDLYFLARRLKELYPTLELHSQIADIRDSDRIDRLGREFLPEYVFHAAAHKHVPLMEDAPEEAVKNNIFGTINVARMAAEVRAERFVLISTDKAVRPSSVMGASKRVAELVVRALASSSDTAFTAIRFGNVLGSAGSVVPLFKQQISRGGPVTVTHPDCTRYFMTIPEAVGMVLLAGLGGYGELCILEMGEPIRIAELASQLITMAGLVPGKDIPIVFTGLRHGEKLAEELLTEDEELTQQVRDRIKVARSTPPPADLTARLELLRRAADQGDADLVRFLLQELVPSASLEIRAKTPDMSRAGSAHSLSNICGPLDGSTHFKGDVRDAL